jgi:release factor glutamine methyltransferase
LALIGGGEPYFGGVTVLEVIQRSSEFLEKKGVESPRLQVELLLAEALGLQRMGLYLNFEREVPPAELKQVRDWVSRRGLREPLQHIIGSTNFCGLELEVNGGVLVPRPETEQLAERAWEFLNKTAGAPTALDFGTGSGCIAIALAVKSASARIVAVDISADALAVARKNAERHGVQDRIEFVAGDGFGALTVGSRFDLIVANPPYIPSAEIATLEPEVRDHDPRLALDGGADGLDFYRRLAGEGRGFLRPTGRMMVELGDGQSGAVREIFEEQKWIVGEVRADYSGRPRILIARL